MTDFPKCPKCGGEFTYFDGSVYVCPDCSHEFDLTDESEAAADVAKDSNGAELFDGDAVTVIKDLKVKGSSMVIKRGTKVRSIRLTENPEEVDCKIDGSSIVLKTCFLKKQLTVAGEPAEMNNGVYVHRFRYSFLFEMSALICKLGINLGT